MPSEKVLKEKEAIVASIAEEIKNAATVVFVDARGLTVEKDTELRAGLRKAGVSYKVRKNTLTLKAVRELGLEGLDDYLKGPTAIAACPNLTDAAKSSMIFRKKIKRLKSRAELWRERPSMRIRSESWRRCRRKKCSSPERWAV